MNYSLQRYFDEQANLHLGNKPTVNIDLETRRNFKMTLFKGYRTRIVALLTVGLGAAQSIIPTVQQSIPHEYYGPILIGIGVVFAILRELTNTAPGESKPSDESR